jgi:hypothetical protein
MCLVGSLPRMCAFRWRIGRPHPCEAEMVFGRRHIDRTKVSLICWCRRRDHGGLLGDPELGGDVDQIGEPRVAATNGTLLRSGSPLPERSIGYGALSTRRALFSMFLSKPDATGKPPSACSASR